MKQLLLLFFIAAGQLSVYGQTGNVGIGTATPAATLDVVGVPGNVSKLDGVIAPRLTGTQLNGKTYTAAQTGAIVYVTAAAPLSGQTINVATPGYYYFNGTVWVALSGSTINTVHARSGSTPQAGVTTGLNIVFGALDFDNTQGFVSYDGTTHRFTLKAGKVYQLEFSSNWISGASGQFARFRWRNVTTNTFIGSVQHCEFATSVSAVAGGGNAVAFIAPLIDIVVDVVYINGDGSSITIGHSTSGTAYPSAKILILN